MLEEIKNFTLENWQLVLAAVLFVIAFIVATISGLRKGLSLGEILTGLISEQLPHWVNKAEKDGGTGEHKKVQVLNEAVNYAAKKLGRKLSEEETAMIVTKASEYIESVLSTPQKKECVEDPKKAKMR